jgi:hypothetical protein
MNHKHSTSLEDVLDQMLFADGAPSKDAVARWSSRYPEFRADLLAFAAGWAEDEHLAPPCVNELRERSLRVAAMNAFRAGEPVAAPRTLAQLAATRGLTLDAIAQDLGIDTKVVIKLDAGRIDPATIGHTLVSHISKFLKVSPANVTASWDRPRAPRAAAAFLGNSILPPRETLRAALIKANTHAQLIAKYVRD